MASDATHLTETWFATPAQWKDLVDRFERAAIPPEAWNHAAHLAVATWYLLWHEPDEALVRVRRGIQQLNAAHAAVREPKVGYHETLTRFYMHAIAGRLGQRDPVLAILDCVNGVVADLADRSLPLRYYSENRLFSPEARATWVTPDLRELSR